VNHLHLVSKFLKNGFLSVGQPTVSKHLIIITINYPGTGLTVDSSQLTFLPSSKSCDTKTRTNIKNPAKSNLGIVP